MKTKAPLIAALLCGLTAVSNAFTLDFAAYNGATIPPSPLVIPVPGYGDVTFASVIGASVVVDGTHQNDDGSGAPSLNLDSGESVKVSFTGLAPVDVKFDFVGVAVGEYFIIQPDLFDPQAFIVTLNGPGNGAGIYAINWNQVPEPASAMLGALGGAVFAFRRRR